VLPALGLLVVGYTDVVLTARAFAACGGYDIDANQELFALGACNIGAGLTRGFPVSSSASRTGLGDAAGSRTQLYSLVALIAVIVTLAFLRPVLAHFPTAALGALVVYAALRLVDVGELRRLARFRRSELLLAVAAAVGVPTVDLVCGTCLLPRRPGSCGEDSAQQLALERPPRTSWEHTFDLRSVSIECQPDDEWR
jgi:MFS superfamily sulfate permease-like transporter